MNYLLVEIKELKSVENRIPIYGYICQNKKRKKTGKINECLSQYIIENMCLVIHASMSEKEQILNNNYHE
jgi:hypothetical protein